MVRVSRWSPSKGAEAWQTGAPQSTAMAPIPSRGAEGPSRGADSPSKGAEVRLKVRTDTEWTTHCAPRLATRGRTACVLGHASALSKPPLYRSLRGSGRSWVVGVVWQTVLRSLVACGISGGVRGLFLWGGLSNGSSMSGFLRAADWSWKARWRVAAVFALGRRAFPPPLGCSGVPRGQARRPAPVSETGMRAYAPLPRRDQPSSQRRWSAGSRRRSFPLVPVVAGNRHLADRTFAVYSVGLAGPSGGRFLSTVVATETTDPGRVSRRHWGSNLGKGLKQYYVRPGRVPRHWPCARKSLGDTGQCVKQY